LIKSDFIGDNLTWCYLIAISKPDQNYVWPYVLVIIACKRYKSLTGDKNGWLPVIKLQCRLVTAKHFTCVMPGHHGHDYDHMVVGFLTTYAISFYHH
jgi:hypothetical protein